jgi:ABC-type Fe3+-hydroxamate transport system substrate-binding protein
MILQSATRHYYPVQKIISLVPSQTELLYYLGLDSETVGITKFCVHPAVWLTSKISIGGTKTVNIAEVEALHPTLIIANKEENVKEQVEALAEKFPVWVTDVNTLEDALQMITDIGILTSTETKAGALATAISHNFAMLQQNIHPPVKTAYLIWRKPYMAAGGGTFIHDMLTQCGFANVLAASPRYPKVTMAQLADTGCELLLLSSEPYPFKQKHIDELQAALPNTKILLADGEMFSWYGSRLLLAPNYFFRLRQLIDS